MKGENMKNKITELLKSTNRKGIENIIEWLNTSDFYTSPASSKYHSVKEGGLAEHSYKVYTIFTEQVEKYEPKMQKDSIILAGLLHDVCKINTYEKPKLTYKRRDDILKIGHGEKSVIELLKRGLELTDEEILLIRWHMGPYDNGYMQEYNTAKEECTGIILLHFADMISSHILETRGKE